MTAGGSGGAVRAAGTGKSVTGRMRGTRNGGPGDPARRHCHSRERRGLQLHDPRVARALRRREAREVHARRGGAAVARAPVPAQVERAGRRIALESLHDRAARRTASTASVPPAAGSNHSVSSPANGERSGERERARAAGQCRHRRPPSRCTRRRSAACRRRPRSGRPGRACRATYPGHEAREEIGLLAHDLERTVVFAREAHAAPRAGRTEVRAGHGDTLPPASGGLRPARRRKPTAAKSSSSENGTGGLCESGSRLSSREPAELAEPEPSSTAKLVRSGP